MIGLCWGLAVEVHVATYAAEDNVTRALRQVLRNVEHTQQFVLFNRADLDARPFHRIGESGIYYQLLDSCPLSMS